MELPTYGRLEAGVSSTNAIHANDTTSIAAGDAAAARRAGAASRARTARYRERDGGHDEVGGERLGVERQPDEHGAASSVRQRPLSHARSAGAAGEHHQQDQHGVHAVVARDGDEGGEHGERERPGERGGDAQAPREDHVQQRYREHAGDRLGQQQAERREAEQLGARGLHPQRQRRLVDGDQAAGVERHEQEVVQRAQHRLDAG